MELSIADNLICDTATLEGLEQPPGMNLRVFDDDSVIMHINLAHSQASCQTVPNQDTGSILTSNDEIIMHVYPPTSVYYIKQVI